MPNPITPRVHQYIHSRYLMCRTGIMAIHPIPTSQGYIRGPSILGWTSSPTSKVAQILTTLGFCCAFASWPSPFFSTGKLYSFSRKCPIQVIGVDSFQHLGNTRPGSIYQGNPVLGVYVACSYARSFPTISGMGYLILVLTRWHSWYSSCNRLFILF